jgi:hypothetical protein
LYEVDGAKRRLMAARRLVAVLVVMLVLSTVAALLVPAPKRDTQSSTSSTTSTTTTTTSSTTAAEQPPGDIVHARIDADQKAKPAPIRLAVGDELRLQVLARRPDQVELRGFGQIEAVGPHAPAVFDVFAFRPGKFDVEMVDARRTVGQVVVVRKRNGG